MKENNEEIVDASEIGWKDVSQQDKAFPYLLRQRPGPGNALGKVKFMFPNQFNVYLHDTPTRHLFNATERDYSHGCVRVEHPARAGGIPLERQTRLGYGSNPEANAVGGRSVRDTGQTPSCPHRLLVRLDWRER